MPKLPSMAPPSYYSEEELDPNSKHFYPEALADELESNPSCEADTFEKPVTAGGYDSPIVPVKSLVGGAPVDTPDDETNMILEDIGIQNPNTFISEKDMKSSEHNDRDEESGTPPDEDLQIIENREEVDRLRKQLNI